MSDVTPQAPQCTKCGHELRAGAAICPGCKRRQKWKACEACKKQIPKKAKICNECSAPQSWWARYVTSTQIKISLLAGILALSYGIIDHIIDWYYWNSHTSFVVTTADSKYIYVSLRNTGRKSAMLMKSRLIFDLPIQSVDLDPMNDNNDSRVISHDGLKVALTTSGLDASVPRTEIERRIGTGQSVTLQLEVRESNDSFKDHHFLRETFPASQIKDFILRNIPSR